MVSPSFVPDSNYTWVLRSRVDQPPSTVTVTTTSFVQPTQAGPLNLISPGACLLIVAFQ